MNEPRAAWGCSCSHGEHMHGNGGCGHKNGHDIYCDCTGTPPSIRAATRMRMLAIHYCKDHKRYQALRAPRSTCEGCWRLWIQMKDNT